MNLPEIVWNPYMDALAIVAFVLIVVAILTWTAPRPVESWYCECAEPDVDSLGECQTCHRKPVGLIR